MGTPQAPLTVVRLRVPGLAPTLRAHHARALCSTRTHCVRLNLSCVLVIPKDVPLGALTPRCSMVAGTGDEVWMFTGFESFVGACFRTPSRGAPRLEQ